MRAALHLDPAHASADLRLLHDDGWPAASPEHLPGIAAALDRVRALEAEHHPRWVWASTPSAYPPLLGAGVRLERCHDVALTEALLDGHAGHWHPVASSAGGGEDHDAVQPTLFQADPTPPQWQQGQHDQRALPRRAQPGVDDVVTRHAEQLTAVEAARKDSPGFAMLVAAESAAALAAVEMTHAGLPWDAARHDALLEAALGPRPAQGTRPAVLADLARQVAAILESPELNPDSQPDLLRALRRAGLPVRTTGRWELADLDHAVVAPLRRYKELSRLFAANGWAWREEWVREGRFRPEYVPGAVVSGRWASRGGGALQIPRILRGAVVADPGRHLILADAGQLEPRVLAALSHDPGMLAATADPSGDLYSALARQSFGTREVTPDARAQMKIALLAAMYGGGAGGAGMAALRRRFPVALAFLEDAARAGEDGGLVRSVLGRTCPPPRSGWLDGLDEEQLTRRARARGRFTRNFVIQASAADWANALVATLRLHLATLEGSELVFFQHDEVIVHAPSGLAGDVCSAVVDAGAQATRLVLPETLPIPLKTTVATTYADKA